MRHKKLVRQVRRSFGVASEQALHDMLEAIGEGGHAPLAHGIASLLTAVERSYQEYDRDLQVRTRMLDISSEELLTANAQLRAEGARQRQVLRSLQISVERLTFDAGGAPEPAPLDPEHDLLGLTHALEQLVQQRRSGAN
ncbi:hypothetical protein LP419_24145 [Massilia sp. H-1]|nr:hypothetical protein LP419_24145 [Massilia sp. H-1]